MIFGIAFDDPDSVGGLRSARLNFNHFESFVLLILFEHGWGPEPYKRLGKLEFEDKCAFYGVAPDNPEFKKAFRRLRLKKTLNRKAIPTLELTLVGSMAAWALKSNNEDFRVKHEIPTIEALAGCLRYAELETVHMNSTIHGGFSPDKVRQHYLEAKGLTEETMTDRQREAFDKLNEEGLEWMLGSGEFFMYDNHVYMIDPGCPSHYDEDYA